MVDKFEFPGQFSLLIKMSNSKNIFKYLNDLKFNVFFLVSCQPCEKEKTVLKTTGKGSFEEWKNCSSKIIIFTTTLKKIYFTLCVYFCDAVIALSFL